MLFIGICGLDLGLYLLTTVALSCLGVWASDRAEAAFGRKDDGRIVIDEVAGQLVTLLPVAALGRAPALVDTGLAVFGFEWWILVVTAFVTFRVLDIWKPGPVKSAEEGFEGGLGVMADDLVAGAIGAVVMTVACYGFLLFALGAAGPMGAAAF